MSKAKFEASAELIREKHYDAARAVLETMPDESRAWDWLAKLTEVEKKNPPIKPLPIKPLKPKRVETTRRKVTAFILVLIALAILAGGIINFNNVIAPSARALDSATRQLDTYYQAIEGK